ncbi:hypothetical protein [Cupriavidus basilensis]
MGGKRCQHPAPAIRSPGPIPEHGAQRAIRVSLAAVASLLRQRHPRPTPCLLRAKTQPSERALPPAKEHQSAMISGGHFTPYLEHFKTTSQAAREWFARHLKP